MVREKKSALKPKRLAWGLTGSGYFLRECLAIAKDIPHCDFFLSKAAAEVLKMYKIDLKALRANVVIYPDNAASAPPVGMFYHGEYHTVVIAPATSNTVAKCVLGISDTLVTNIFAQAGKTRVPAIVLACDNEPEVDTEAPREWVTLYPRKIDLEMTEKLREMDGVHVVDTPDALATALRARLASLA
jgi:dihydromethanopterin reductase (acceptor)